jgi:Zn-dependent protease with chaperone function
LLHAARLLRLLAAAGTQVDDDVIVVDSSMPLSLAVGMFRPKIYLSSRLATALTPDVLSVVLEHERAHVRRRDALRKLAASVLSLGHLPWMRRRLLCDLSLACEQACDDEAAQGA